MALTLVELNQLVADSWQTDPFTTWQQREDQMHYRSLYVKHDWQLVWARDMFVSKIARLVQFHEDIRQGRFPNIPIEEACESYRQKLIRLALKYRDVRTEIRIRELDMFDRNPIGTTYYIDLDNGSNSNDGLSTGAAWLTLEQFTTTTVRTAGDIAKIRAGTSETVGANHIIADEDGNAANGLIKLIGCTTLDDPWGDGSNVRPIIDFNGQAYAMYWDSDQYWGFYNLEVKGSAFNTWNCGQWGIFSPYYAEVKNCKIQEARHASSAYGLLCQGGGSFLIEDCIIEGNRTSGLRCTGTNVRVRRSVFNGGGTYSQDYAVIVSGGHVIFEECQMGQTTAHDTCDSTVSDAGIVYFIGCTTRDLTSASYNWNGTTRWEKHTWAPSGSLSASGSQNIGARIEYQTGVVRSGGSSFALKITPVTNYVNINKFVNIGLIGSGFEDAGFPLRLYLPAGTYTITLYARADAAFSVYPTAEELYLEATYFDESSGSSMAYMKSDEVLSDGSSWVGFNVTITTGQAGYVFCDFRFGKYEASRYIYVDPLPVIS